MPVELHIGPPVLTINAGSTFMVTDFGGEVPADGEAGLFAADTRFMSYYAIFANGEPWLRLSSTTLDHDQMRIDLTNPALRTEEGDVPPEVLLLGISRTVAEGVHEDLDLASYARTSVHFNLEIAIRADFADLFEVKSHRFVRRGRIETEWHARERALRVTYRNRDFFRALVVHFEDVDVAPVYANGRCTFDLTLKPGATWHACVRYEPLLGEHASAGRASCPRRKRGSKTQELRREWSNGATRLESSNADLSRAWRQAVDDLGALRLHEHDMERDVWVPAAGVPWFVTLFGRDSLIASLQTMPVNAGFARGALQLLGTLQANETDDWRDAEPGKILHEIRYGELAHFRRIPHTPYYGTADATPLYVVALHEAWRWLGDRALVERHLPVAERCLEWIDRYGDLDSDGLQEYRTRSEQGYENMGWKDHADAVVYPDGSNVPQPKALVELQGYVFDAWLRMAELYDALGRGDRASDLRARAAALRERVEERFWVESEGTYGFALDKDKRRVDTIVSNAGHLLWSGLPSPERAARVVSRLLADDMWSGWGIRTLSARNGAYNPLSYHTGSVWPHDNGIIALGFERYGFRDEAARVARAVFDAASCFQWFRLPELYAGVARAEGSFPVEYRRANVPQAWAAGAVFHLVAALLGLGADAPRGRLRVDPALPDWLPDLTLRGLRVGKAKLALRFWRDRDRSRWEILDQDGDITVVQEPWLPWRSESGKRAART